MWDPITLDALHDQKLARARKDEMEKVRRILAREGGPCGAAGRNTPAPTATTRAELLYSIDVFPDVIVLSRYGRDDRVARSCITAEEAEAIFAGPKKRAAAWEMIEPGVIATRPAAGTSRGKLLLLRPAGKASLTMIVNNRRETIACVLPPLLAEMDYDNGSGGRRRWRDIPRVFALPEKKPTRASILYACPVPNCYGDGTWCRGEVSVDRDDMAGQPAIEVFASAFLTGSLHTAHGTTNPLSKEGMKKYKTVLGLLRACRTAPPAIKYLKPVMTLGELLEGRTR